MSQAASLYRLQQTDSQIERSQTRLQVIAKLLSDNNELNSALMLAESTRQNRQTIEQAVHQAEANVQDQRTKIELTEANLYSGTVQNPKELQDLQNEVSALKRHLVTLEDQLLEKMISLDEAESENRQALEKLNHLQTSINDEHANLLQEQRSLHKEIEKFTAEKQAVISAIPSEDLLMYEKLREDRRGVAVAGVTENSCGVCGAQLTPAQLQAVRSLQKTTHCSTCGRILYVIDSSQ